MFLDCFNRKIEVGHVLANGQRQSTHGGITVGVVTGFTASTIRVKTLHIKTVYHAPEGQENLPYYQRRYSREHEEALGYYWRNSSYREPKNCFITGQTEEELVEGITAMLGIEEIEDPRIASNREWKEKWAARQAELEKAKQESGLDEITRISEEAGLYD